MNKVHHCGSLTTGESNLLLAVRRGTMGFATSMVRLSYQLFSSVAAKPNDSIMEWHARLGYTKVEDVAMIQNHDLADGCSDDLES